MADLEKYSSEFSDSSFFDKVTNFAKKAGCGLLEKAFTLYYTAKDPDTSTKAKAIIYGALGYFIIPLDAIPDVTPVVGFSDDLTALATALTMVAMSIKKSHKEEAQEKINSFGC